MKAGIIHFSDIHLESNTDAILLNKDTIARACISSLNQCSKIIVIVTGDIAYSGSKTEYEIALEFFREIERLVRQECRPNTYEYFIVPGNHDCKFQESDSVRKVIKTTVLSQDIVDDSQFIEVCLKPQEDFWNFYCTLTGAVETPSLSRHRAVQLMIDKTIHVCSYNTAFLSELNESVGTLLVPENCFIDLHDSIRKDDIVISLFHHVTNWLSPNTPNNNKRKFEQHLMKSSNIIMCGHEHSSNQQIISDLEKNEDLIYLEGSALQNNKESEFSVYVYDTTENLLHKTDYSLDEDFYKIVSENDICLKPKNAYAILNDGFARELNNIEIPIKHPIKEKLVLEDIFVWQDLESINESEDYCIQYIDAQDIISESPSDDIIFIEGEPQSGKSSLIKMSYQLLLNKGLYPILINGKDIKHPNVLEVIKKQYKLQYQYGNFPYEKFNQLLKSQKVVLIDDFNSTSLNTEARTKLLENLLQTFSRVIIVSTIQNDIKSLLIQKNTKNDFRRYRLSSLGFEKRNALIEKWIRLGKDVYTCDEFAVESEIKLTFDQITDLLGEQLVPSYPVFILSLLQSLNQSFKKFDISQTSYAFCYKSLIIAALVRSGVPAERIDGVINVIKEFAYELYNSGKALFTDQEFNAFYIAYSEKFRTPFSSDKVMEILCSSNILKVDNDGLKSFSYRYIYYYLVAMKISTMDDRAQIDSIVDNLCSCIHLEQNANILIFLIHHTGSKNYIDNLLYASMLPFEDVPMATLAIGDPLFKDLRGLVDEIKSEVLIEDTNSKEERSKSLKASDQAARQIEKSNSKISDVENEDPDVRDLNNTFRIIRILGQIVKNQSETFEKSKLIELIEESYKVGFRTIGFFTKLVDDNKEDIIKFFLEENRKNRRFSDKELEERVQKLLQLMLYRVCLSTFSNISFAVGNSGMSEIYDSVANKIDSPAAKVVSFTIKTYYNAMKISDLKEIVEEFKDNPVVLEIIKARVIRYVYHNPVAYNIRQQIGTICNMKLINNASISKHQVEKRD